jgi:hypothetical protein
LEIINAYLAEIHRRLPLKNRRDIIEEIRSALMDMIEERNPTPESDPDEALIKSVLKEYGSPRKVAQQYGAHQHLIGPQIFPNYLMVLKIVLIVVASVNILFLLVAAIRGSFTEPGLLTALIESFGGLFNSLFYAFGMVTLIFTIIERTAGEQWEFESEEEWSPDDLVVVKEQTRVSIGGQAVEITLGIIFILLINVYLDRIGIYYLGDSGWVSVPILNDNFTRYIPWITGVAALDIALNLYLIGKVFWNRSARLAKVFINVLKIALLAVIILGPTIITISPAAWEVLDLDAGFSAQRLGQTLNTLLDVVLGAVIIGLLVESGQRLFTIFRKGGPSDIQFKVE